MHQKQSNYDKFIINAKIYLLMPKNLLVAWNIEEKLLY